MLGGSPGRLDAAAALAMPGVERLVRLPAYAGSTAGFAIIAKTSWHAMQAVAAVDVEWRQRPAGALDSGRIAETLKRAVREERGPRLPRAAATSKHAESQAARGGSRPGTARRTWRTRRWSR